MSRQAKRSRTFSLLRRAIKRQRRKQQDQSPLRFESLEQRSLLAITPISFDLGTGVITITGTMQKDSVFIKSIGDTEIRVSFSSTADSAVQSYEESTVSKIVFDALDGNDSFTNSTFVPSEVRGGAGADVISGGSGNDELYGDEGNDVIYGREGDDRLDGGAGLDDIFGGVGNDVLWGGSDDDYLDGGDGHDELFGGSGDDKLLGRRGNDSLFGESGVDRLFGDQGDDLILGGADRDYLYGGDNDDRLEGGSGDDDLFGEAGKDVLRGGTGNDYLEGGDGNDELFGGNGDDRLKGRLGDDDLYGEAGSDRLYGDQGDDLIVGGEDRDYLYGGDDNDRLDGGAGDDDLFGKAGKDVLRGGSGKDYLDGGEGNDELFGGGGDDKLNGRLGNDDLYGEAGSDHLYGNQGDDLIVGGEDGDYLDGGDDNDRLDGGSGNDKLSGGAGHDLLWGGIENDILDGSYGNDQLFGEAGDDVLRGGNNNDYLDAGDGNDDLFGGSGDDDLHGRLGDDYLFGEAGTDRLYGNQGNDQLIGGDQRDFLYGGSGGDRLEGGAENDSLFGGAGDDVLSGGNDNDYLDAGAGDDELFGESGDDVLRGGNGNDYLQGGDGNDQLYGGSGDDDLLGLLGDDSLFGEMGKDVLYGNQGNDLIIGGDQRDLLYGEEGNDLLVGGEGIDELFGSAGEDILISASTVYDESESDLKSILEIWNSSSTFAHRIATLSSTAQDSVGLVINKTVLDDAVSNDVYGGSENDWMIMSSINPTFDPVGTSDGPHVVHQLPRAEGFSLIDSFDAFPDQTTGDTLTHVLPHGTNPVHAAEHLQLFQLVRYVDVTHTAIASGSWSDPSIWQDGLVPDENSRVLIPIGTQVLIDTELEPEVFSVRVDGALSFSTDRDTELRVDTMVVNTMGRLEIGTADNPVQSGVTARLVFTDNGEIDRSWDPFGVSRGLITHGTFNVHGDEKTSFVEVQGSLPAGSRFITLDSIPTNWQVGDTVLIAGTREDQAQDEERQILSINGSTLEVAPLTYAHVSPSSSMQFHIANLTRNVILESEGTVASRRGHVMMMHSRNVDIAYASFDRLGRTDKSINFNDPDVNDNWQLIPGTGTNPRARYAVHFHRTGSLATGTPSLVVGSVVRDAVGWGYVNHSSYVDVFDSIAYDVLGSGFVAEVGNEVGLFEGNLAIKLEGSGQETEARETLPDFGHGGEGFWLQSPGITVVNNVVAGANAAGYTYYLRGYKEFFGIPTRFDSENLLDPSIADGASTIATTKVPIREFSNNVAYASAGGIDAFYVLETSTKDVVSTFSDSVFWNVRHGIFAPYSKDLVISNVTILNDSTPSAEFGFGMNGITADITFIDVDVRGFQYGIWLTKRGFTNIVSGTLANHVNVAISSPLSEDRTFTVGTDVELLPNLWE